MSTDTSAGRHPALRAPVTRSTRASACSCSQVRSSVSGVACSAATAASSAAEKRASASGSNTRWVWVMPGLVVEPAAQRSLPAHLFLPADAVVTRQASFEVADVTFERLHRRRTSGRDQRLAERGEIGLAGVVEVGGGAGDGVDMTGRHRPGRQRVVQLGHRRADVAACRSGSGVTPGAPPAAGQHRGRRVTGTVGGEFGGAASDGGFDGVEPSTTRASLATRSAIPARSHVAGSATASVATSATIGWTGMPHCTIHTFEKQEVSSAGEPISSPPSPGGDPSPTETTTPRLFPPIPCRHARHREDRGRVA